jgi:hypothetical protein
MGGDRLRYPRRLRRVFAADALGAHLANRRGGKLWANVLTSVGVTAVGLGVLEATGVDALYIAIPIAQLVAVVAMERALMR